MYLVARHQTYKTTSGIVTHAFGRIIELPMKVGRIVCQMVLLVVNIDNYDLLFGLDFFMKIGVVVNVEKGVIQVHNGDELLNCFW